MRKRPNSTKNRLRQLFAKKHYRDKMEIRGLSSGLRDSFDRAYDIAKSSILAGMRSSEEQYAILNDQIKEIEWPEDEPPSDEALGLFDELGQVMYSITLDTDALLSLEEMRVIYAYKTLEKAVGGMLCVAFPKVNKKDLFKWEAVKSCLSINGIRISQIAGYAEANGLRIVNNNIKHSVDLNDETRNIPFWKDETEFTHENLPKFYELIKDKVLLFAEKLGDALISNVFELDEEKIDTLASEIADRLNNEQISLLIDKLNSKL
jgi:hypothetical protein